MGVSGSSQTLELNAFGFNIPSGATINGIVARVERRKAGTATIKDKVIRLIKAGSEVGDNKADTATAWPAADAFVTYGGASDLWGGAPWTTGEINSSLFGVHIKVDKSDGSAFDITNAEVDSSDITVYYTP